jgi:DNA-binding protein HU-beta
MRIITTALLCLLALTASIPAAFAGNSTAVLAEYQRLTGASDAEARAQFGAAMAAVKNELKSGREVTVQNFGRFYVQDREPREARNPRTGEKLQVEAKRYPRFVSSDTFKAEMNIAKPVVGAVQPAAIQEAPKV